MNLYLYISRLLQPLRIMENNHMLRRENSCPGCRGNKVDQCNTQILLIQLKTSSHEIHFGQVAAIRAWCVLKVSQHVG